MCLKLYKNLKIGGGEMNELYKFQGVKKHSLHFVSEVL